MFELRKCHKFSAKIYFPFSSVGLDTVGVRARSVVDRFDVFIRISERAKQMCRVIFACFLKIGSSHTINGGEDAKEVYWVECSETLAPKWTEMKISTFFFSSNNSKEKKMPQLNSAFDYYCDSLLVLRGMLLKAIRKKWFVCDEIMQRAAKHFLITSFPFQVKAHAFWNFTWNEKKIIASRSIKRKMYVVFACLLLNEFAIDPHMPSQRASAQINDTIILLKNLIW